MLARFLVVLAALGVGQEIPSHPDKLKYKSLDWEVPKPEAYRSVLKNGMVVYAKEDRSLPKVDLTLLIRAGSFWEPRGKEGLASITGTVMRTGGTELRSPEELDEKLESLAIDLDVSIGDTSASATLSALTKYVDDGLTLLVEVLSRPSFRQDKLDLAKAQTVQSMQTRNDSPASIESREVSLLLYGDYPVNAHPTKGSVDSIAREDLIAFHRRFFHPSAMILAAAGDFSKKEFLEKLERAFADCPTPAPEKASVPPVAHEPAPGVYCFQDKLPRNPQGRVTIGHLGIDLHHPDAFAIRVMSYIFGAGGFASRLMKVVRTDEGLAYDVRCDYRPGIAHRGTFRMAFQSRSESCLYAAALCLREMERMQKEEVSAEELQGAIQFYVDAFPALFFSTPAQTVSTLAGAEFHKYPKDYYQTYRENISAVTAADIKRVAREHMTRDRLVFVLVGNLSAIKGGDGKHDVKIEQFGAVQDVPLPDPMTLVRPK